VSSTESSKKESGLALDGVLQTVSGVPGREDAQDAPAADESDLEATGNNEDTAFKRIDEGPVCLGITTHPDYYPPPAHFRSELRRAPSIYQGLSEATRQLIASARLGQALDPAPLAKPLKKMLSSIGRHPDALLWMVKLHGTGDYTVDHAVRSAVLSAALVRHVGLAEEPMRRIALGALLCQIGKAKLPRKLLEKRDPLDERELERIRDHVALGVDLLKRCRTIEDEVIQVVANHQERFDGSGYPAGKRGDEIPLPARIAGLVHCYDAMTSVRPHTDGILTNAENLEFLYDQRDRLFQGQLVEELIQMLGIYPTGTLVELSTGAIAVVAAQNREHRTQPQVLLVLDPNREPYATYEKVDINGYNASHPDTTVTVRRGVPVGEFDINPLEVMEKHASVKRFGLGWLKR